MTATEKVRLLAVLREFRAFLSSTVFGDVLENVAAISGADELATWAEGRPGDLPRFLAIARDLDLARCGRASDTFLSYGAYAHGGRDGQPLFARGVWQGESRPFDAQLVREDVTHAWLHGERPLVHPGQGETRPLTGAFADKASASPGAKRRATKEASSRPAPWLARWSPGSRSCAR